MSCEPIFDYGQVPAQWEYDGPGYSELVATGEGSDAQPRASPATCAAAWKDASVRARSRMVEGDEVFVALSWSPLPPPRTFAEAKERLDRTAEYWRQWITAGEFPDHPWRGYLQRSALTLKGLTYAPSGALLAASTTSLPGDARR